MISILPGDTRVPRRPQQLQSNNYYVSGSSLRQNAPRVPPQVARQPLARILEVQPVMAATAARRFHRKTMQSARHAWRAVKRRPVPLGIGAVVIAGVLAFGAVGAIADQGPEPVRGGFGPAPSEQHRGLDGHWDGFRDGFGGWAGDRDQDGDGAEFDGN
jgi:hypothetical protein